jgi:hypothetical protein
MTRQKSINWVSPEVLALVNQEVEKSPKNLSVAFETIAYVLDTNVNNVVKAWYRVLKFKVKGFTVTSKRVKSVNIKNERRITEDVKPIHEAIVSTKIFDGMKVVTIKQYFIA